MMMMIVQLTADNTKIEITASEFVTTSFKIREFY